MERGCGWLHAETLQAWTLGRDASRAFVTGDFSDAGLVDDVADLSSSEMLTLQTWLSFYEKNYVCVVEV